MNRISLIISLKFRAAHVSHLVASYRQMNDLGYNSILYVHKDFIPFLPKDIRYVTDLNGLKQISIAIFWFPALVNICKMIKLRLQKVKIIYVYHEPIEDFRSYINSGNSFGWTLKFFAKYYAGLSFILLSNKIILPSKKALQLYQKNVTRLINKNYSYLPLLYEDENCGHELKRIYFSYIGGISYDHAFDKFVDFIYQAYKNNDFPNLKFLIASWRKIPKDERIDEMRAANKLDIIAGSPLTNEEINQCYASTFLIWNAYNRTTQSGVLAKSFMFGTPGLILKRNISEFIENNREVIAIDSNTDYIQIASALYQVLNNFESFSNAAKTNFNRNYNYKIHNERMAAIINSL